MDASQPAGLDEVHAFHEDRPECQINQIGTSSTSPHRIESSSAISLGLRSTPGLTVVGRSVTTWTTVHARSAAIVP
jgi:hypothetical protein